MARLKKEESKNGPLKGQYDLWRKRKAEMDEKIKSEILAGRELHTKGRKATTKLEKIGEELYTIDGLLDQLVNDNKL